jgi:hypothetical protein
MGRGEQMQVPVEKEKQQDVNQWESWVILHSPVIHPSFPKRTLADRPSYGEPPLLFTGHVA